MDIFGLHPPPNLLDKFDLDLQEFYYRSVTKEMNIRKKKNALRIKQARKEVVDSYKSGTGSPPVRFNSSAKRCGYLLKFSPCFTSAVAFHLAKMLDRNCHVLQEAVRLRRLNICCLGGGPASDAVAVCKVLSAVQGHFWIRDPRPLDIRVTVVDISEDWRITIRHVLQTLEESPAIFDSDKMSLSFELIKADLTQSIGPDVHQALQNADVITMVYFLSAIHRSPEKRKCPQILYEAMKRMKTGAVLFCLDSSLPIFHGSIQSISRLFESRLDEIYNLKQPVLHKLSLNSLRKYIELYAEIFNTHICLTYCFISVSVWLNTGHRSPLTNLNLRAEDIKDPEDKQVYACQSLLHSNLSQQTQELNDSGEKQVQSPSANSLKKKWYIGDKKVATLQEKVEELYIAKFGLSDFNFDFDNQENESEFSENDFYSYDRKILFQTKGKVNRIFANTGELIIKRKKSH